MITCYLKLDDENSKMIKMKKKFNMVISLIENCGGEHHGYFFSSEQKDKVVLHMFTFPTLVEYEKYRLNSLTNIERIVAPSRKQAVCRSGDWERQDLVIFENLRPTAN
jgi:hypothetical protein